MYLETHYIYLDKKCNFEFCFLDWLFTYKDWLSKNKMAAGDQSGDEEEDAKINVSSQDNSHRLKVIGTKKRNCKY